MNNTEANTINPDFTNGTTVRTHDERQGVVVGSAFTRISGERGFIYDVDCGGTVRQYVGTELSPVARFTNGQYAVVCTDETMLRRGVKVRVSDDTGRMLIFHACGTAISGATESRHFTPWRRGMEVI